jgi:hypothetical protein
MPPRIGARDTFAAFVVFVLLLKLFALARLFTGARFISVPFLLVLRFFSALLARAP